MNNEEQLGNTNRADVDYKKAFENEYTNHQDTHKALEQAQRERDDLLETAKWAVDLIEIYDGFLIRLGEPKEKVHSEIHETGMAKAHLTIKRYDRSSNN